MEIFKKWGLFVIMLMLPLGFVACSDDDDDNSSSASSIVGTWYGEIDDSYDEYEIEVTFKADGTGRFVEYDGYSTNREDFEYTVNGRYLTLIFEDSYSGYETDRYIFEINKNKLYLYDHDEEDDLEMVLTRQ